MSRRDFVILGLLLICIIAMILFKRRVKEGFAIDDKVALVSTFAGSGIAGSADGVDAATFNAPIGIAIDSSGNLYIADTSNHRIRKIDTSGSVSTFAGSTAGFADGVGAAAQFKTPYAIAIDSSNNLYVADSGNNIIRKIDIIGNVTTIAGSSFGFADGASAAAKFNYPRGMAIDSSNNLYIIDTFNHRIRKIDVSGLVSTFAGSTAGFADGVGVAAQFKNPSGITIDSSNNLYIADGDNHIIRKIDTIGNVSTIAGSGTAGSADGVGVAAQFKNPRGIAIDSLNNLYIADSGNNKIRKIDTTGNVTTFAGSETAGTADGIGTAVNFSSPKGIAIDTSGNLYIADSGNHKIRKIALSCPAGTFVIDSTCTPCAAGSYSSSSDVISCTPCPAGQTTTSTGSTLVSQCQPISCAQGEYLVGSTCIACGQGKFSAAGANICSDCAAGSYSAAGSASCTACSAGTYSGAGAGTCAACAAGLISEEGASSCTQCAAGKYTDNNKICKTCDPGSYSVAGSSACTACDPGKYGGGAEENSCLPCPTGKFSGAGAASCMACNPGSYSDDGKTCKACSAGSYSAYGTSCETCAAGTFSAAEASTCSPCADGSFSSAGAESCSPCVAGTFSVNGEPCKPCSAGQFSGSGAISCSFCKAILGASEMDSLTTSCKAKSCIPGYKLVDGKCEQCGDNTYGTGSQCFNCPTGSTSSAGSTSLSDCSCPLNTYMNHITSQCTACPTGSTSSAGSTSLSSCKFSSCSPGRELLNGQCLKCGANTYGTGGTSQCINCPEGSTSSAGSTSEAACSCSVNSYFDSASSQCKACPTGSISSAGSTSLYNCSCITSSGATNMNLITAGSTNCSASSCSPGHELVNGQCMQCGANTYGTGGTSQCANCPAGSTSSIGSTSAAACLSGSSDSSYGTDTDTSSGTVTGTRSASWFEFDYWFGTGTNPPKCPPNTYMNNGFCVYCPAGSTSSAGSTSLSACSCIMNSGVTNMNPIAVGSTNCSASSCSPGYQLSNGKCIQCGENTYGKDGFLCSRCPEGTASAVGSISLANCGTYNV